LQDNSTLREACLKLGYLNSQEFDQTMKHALSDKSM